MQANKGSSGLWLSWASSPTSLNKQSSWIPAFF